MASQTTNIKSDINTGEYGWGDTVNSNFKLIDCLLFPFIQDSIQGTTPSYKTGDNSEGYIVSGKLNDIDADVNTLLVPSNSGWMVYTPNIGMIIYYNPDKNLKVFNGSSWVSFNSYIGFDNLATLVSNQQQNIDRLTTLTKTSFNSLLDTSNQQQTTINNIQSSLDLLKKTVSDNLNSTTQSISNLQSSVTKEVQDRSNDTADIRSNYFLASGPTGNSSTTEVDWKSNSGVYTLNYNTESRSLVQFKGTGSAPTLQLQYTYGNGGLWYRSSRDQLGFEKDLEQIVTERAGTALLARRLVNTCRINDAYFDGSKDIDIGNIKASQTTNLKPSDVSGSRLTLSLIDRAAIDPSLRSTDISDALSLDSSSDNTKGNQNLIVASRNNQALYHYISSSWNGATWMSPKQIAYTDSNITGNSGSTTKLQTAVKINGTPFDGSYDVTVPASFTVLDRNSILNNIVAPGFYSCLQGAEAVLINNKPEDGVFSLLVESTGHNKQTFTSIASGNTYIRTFLAGNSNWSNWRSVLFNDSDSAHTSITAQRLLFARNINSVPFDGTADITIFDNTKLPLSGGNVTGKITATDIVASNSLTTTSGTIQTDQYHYINMGKPLNDVMLLGTWGGSFSFRDTNTNNEVVGISSSGIRATSVNSLNSDLTLSCGDSKWIYLTAGSKSTIVKNDGSVTADKFYGNLSGTASYADQLTSARNISLTGVIKGQVTFKGDQDVVINTSYTEDSLTSLNYTKSANGFVKLTGGLILQWGSVDYNSEPGERGDTAVFPIAFPTACLQATATRKFNPNAYDTPSADGTIGIISTQTDKILVNLQSIKGWTGDLRGWSYMAIGY